jgi:Mor family transcriptional regulator
MNTALHNMDGYPELLEDLWAKIAEVLIEGGIHETKAREAAFAVTEYIRAEWGGRRHYTPKGRTGAKQPEPGSGTLFAEPAPSEPARIEETCLAALREKTAVILGDMKIPFDAALPDAVTELVKNAWVGEFVYLPRGRKYDLRRRDYAIWMGWDGSYRSKLALMKKHNISEIRFYQIVALVRRSEHKRTQPALPGVETTP